MKLYVAGKWQERVEVRKLQDKLRELGHIITVDWTGHEMDDPGYPNQYASDDLRGVKECNAYVGLFVNPHAYKGALVELGIALGRGKRIFIIGHAIDSCLFVSHSLVMKFNTEKDFMHFVKLGMGDAWVLNEL